MNGKRKVLVGFTTDSNDYVLVEAKTVVSSMTNNSFFELPVPPMVEVALGVETYENAQHPRHGSEKGSEVKSSKSTIKACQLCELDSRWRCSKARVQWISAK